MNMTLNVNTNFITIVMYTMYSIIHVLESITSANPHSKESFFQTYKYLIHTKLSKLYCVLFSPPDFEY